MRKILRFLPGFYLLFSAAGARGAGLIPCSGLNCRPCHLIELIVNIFNFVLKDIVPPVAGLAFLIGGIMILTAGASQKNLDKGKSIFKNTALGVIIILSAWVLVNTIFIIFAVNIEGFDPNKWWQVTCK